MRISPTLTHIQYTPTSLGVGWMSVSCWQEIPRELVLFLIFVLVLFYLYCSDLELVIVLMNLFGSLRLSLTLIG